MFFCTEKQQQLIAEAGAILAGAPAGKLLDSRPVGDIADPDERRTAIDAILAPYDLRVDFGSTGSRSFGKASTSCRKAGTNLGWSSLTRAVNSGSMVLALST